MPPNYSKSEKHAKYLKSTRHLHPGAIRHPQTGFQTPRNTQKHTAHGHFQTPSNTDAIRYRQTGVQSLKHMPDTPTQMFLDTCSHARCLSKCQHPSGAISHPGPEASCLTQVPHKWRGWAGTRREAKHLSPKAQVVQPGQTELISKHTQSVVESSQFRNWVAKFPSDLPSL